MLVSETQLDDAVVADVDGSRLPSQVPGVTAT